MAAAGGGCPSPEGTTTPIYCRLRAVSRLMTMVDGSGGDRDGGGGVGGGGGDGDDGGGDGGRVLVVVVVVVVVVLLCRLCSSCDDHPCPSYLCRCPCPYPCPCYFSVLVLASLASTTRPPSFNHQWEGGGSEHQESHRGWGTEGSHRDRSHRDDAQDRDR